MEMMGAQDYPSVEYDSTLGSWAVYDSQGVVETYDDRSAAAQGAVRIGRADQSYTYVEVYGRDGGYLDTIQFGGRAGGPADGMAEATGQMLLIGGGTMMGIGAIDAIGEMF
jgi:hypothetical protein